MLKRYLHEPFREVVDLLRGAQAAGILAPEVRPEVALFLFLGAGSHLFHVAALAQRSQGTSEGLPNAHGNTKDDYRNATRTLCEDRGAVYLDGKDAIPNDPVYFVDGIHPNDRGHKAMARFLLLRLRALGWMT